MDSLTTLFNDPDPAILVLVLVFICVFLLVAGIGALMMGSDPVVRRLAATRDSASEAGASLRYGAPSGVIRWLQPLHDKAAPKDPQLRSTMRRALVQAGYHRPDALNLYFTIRLVLAVVLPSVVIPLLPFLYEALRPQTLGFAALAAASLGFYGPAAWVRLRISQRQQAFREGFPDALDLLLVCVESGSSLSASMQKVAKEIGTAYPIIAEHFQRLGLELQAGVDKATALRNMSARVGISEVNSFVTLLIQSEALGASIAQSLRVHADEMRRKRLMTAEESANKIPVKLAIPLVLFVLPSLMMAVMTPAIINIARNFLKM